MENKNNLEVSPQGYFLDFKEIAGAACICYHVHNKTYASFTTITRIARYHISKIINLFCSHTYTFMMF